MPLGDFVYIRLEQDVQDVQEVQGGVQGIHPVHLLLVFDENYNLSPYEYTFV